MLLTIGVLLYRLAAFEEPPRSLAAGAWIALITGCSGLPATVLLRLAAGIHQQQPFRRSVPLLLLWCAVGGALAAACWYWLYYFSLESAPYLPVQYRGPVYLALWATASVLCAVWVWVYADITFYRKARRQAQAHEVLLQTVRDAELLALRAQLNPHFHFNSLNALRALIPRELERPRAAVTLIADLLRSSLLLGRKHVVPLAEELLTVEQYLAIEQLRFETRLRVRKTVAAETLSWSVPPFAVQTLVENAVKYGIARREEGGEIGLEAEVREGRLRVSVTNPGTLATTSESTGLGLKNVRARLALLFGSAARLTLTQTGPNLVTALLELPALAAEAGQLPAPDKTPALV